MNRDHQAPGEHSIRVLVADNSRMHTRLLADALKLDPVLEVVPLESDSAGLLEAIKTQAIDVLVIGSGLDEIPSRCFEILQGLRALRLKTRAVLLLDSSKDEAILKAFRAGALGVFGRSEPIELLRECVRCVYQGQVWASSQAMRVAVEALANSPNVQALNASGVALLSERELQVVRCMAEGLTNREIAERLQLSQHTVKNYFFRIFDKLGVSSRVELLFMTLSQSGVGSALLKPADAGKSRENGHSEEESELLKKAEETGLPAAQLSLAQLYLTRCRDSQDLVLAYMWYLIATKRAVQTRGFITKQLTPQQIDEAKQRAAAWLSKRKRPASSSASSAT